MMAFSIASTSVAAAPVPITTAHNLDTPTNTNLATVTTIGVDSVHTRYHCDCACTENITCESITQRLANKYLRHQPTFAIPAEIILTAPAHLLTAWAF
nr:unnamed protein product [Spirometra erinaceieuropaei]